MKFSKAAAYSLVLHVLLAIGFLAHLSKSRRRETLGPAMAPVKVRLVPQSASLSPKGFQSKGVLARTGSPSPGSSADLRKLFQLNPDSAAPSAMGPNFMDSGSGQVARDERSRHDLKFNGGTGSAQIYGNLSAAQWLGAFYQRVDENFVYPSELSDANIAGDVIVELHFGVTGEAMPKIKTLYSSSPYLRVAVTRTLKRVLDRTMPENLKKVPASQVVIAHFTFEITEPHSDITNAERQLRAGNAFDFYRNVVKSKLAWNVGPFSGLFVAPTVAINPQWFVDEAQAITHPQQSPKVDPLESYRRDPEFKDTPRI